MENKSIKSLIVYFIITLLLSITFFKDINIVSSISLFISIFIIVYFFDDLGIFRIFSNSRIYKQIKNDFIKITIVPYLIIQIVIKIIRYLNIKDRCLYKEKLGIDEKIIIYIDNIIITTLSFIFYYFSIWIIFYNPINLGLIRVITPIIMIYILLPIDIIYIILKYSLEKINTTLKDNQIKKNFFISFALMVLLSYSMIFLIVNNSINISKYVSTLILVLLFLVFCILSISTFILSLHLNTSLEDKINIKNFFVVIIIIVILNIICLYLGNIVLINAFNNSYNEITDGRDYFYIFYKTLMSILGDNLTPLNKYSKAWNILTSLFNYIVLSTFISSTISSYQPYSTQSKK